MKKPLVFIVLMISFLLNSTNVTAGTANLKVSSNNRFLTHLDNSPFFPNGDTCWEIPWDLTRSEVETYLQTRKNQKFNMVGINSFDWNQSRNSANRYGDQPFVMASGKYDPTQPIVTPGNNPNNSTEYDYWDNLEYIIDLAASKGIYVALLPCWGDSRVNAGSNSRIFTESSAYTYGQWLGNMFSDKTNIIWMIGGDDIPGAYENTFRKMAEGVADGVNGVNNNNDSADYSTTLMSYHPPKWQDSSSAWFHNDAFMDFNSTQDEPSAQITRITSDYALSPTKATWLFEGGYEERVKAYGTYTDWQCRFQAYQTVFAGGFGHMYGHMSIWEFKSDWATKINATGANDMQHLLTLMTSVSNQQFLTRIPDQSLLDGDTGTMTESEGMVSTCIVATRTSNGDNAMIYSANGRNIRVKMSLLAGPTKTAQWFDPRSGIWSSAGADVPSGSGAAIAEFDPPGSPANGNDFILVLGGDVIPPEPFVPVDPYTDTVFTRALLHCDSFITNQWPNDSATNCYVTPDDNSSGRPAAYPILNSSNIFNGVTIGIDNSTIPTFKTNSPYSGDYLSFDGNDSIIVTNGWTGGDSMFMDFAFRLQGLPEQTPDNWMALLTTFPVKAYIRNNGDDTYGKLTMLVYDGDVVVHYLTPNKLLSSNVWYHLSFSISNNNVEATVGSDSTGYSTATDTIPGLFEADGTDVIIGNSWWVPTRSLKGDLDEIRWGTIVPEPSILFAGILLGLAFLRRK